MNKRELVVAVAESSRLTQVDAERAIDATLEAITHALKKKEDVRLIGFGTFTVAERPVSEGRNPRTGATIKIPAKHLPKFRAGKQLKDAVDAQHII